MKYWELRKINHNIYPLFKLWMGVNSAEMPNDIDWEHLSTGKTHTPLQMTQSSTANSVNDVKGKSRSCSVYLLVSYSKYTRKLPVDIKWKMKILLGNSRLLHVILG